MILVSKDDAEHFFLFTAWLFTGIFGYSPTSISLIIFSSYTLFINEKTGGRETQAKDYFSYLLDPKGI